MGTRARRSCPQPDDGDVFLDFEGHPFWRADTGLFFLFGCSNATATDSGSTATRWAHDQERGGDAAGELIDYLVDRREQFPGMHVYHYNHTERSSLERLTADHGVAEAELTELIETGAVRRPVHVVALNAFRSAPSPTA